jgi:hypothetical protein
MPLYVVRVCSRRGERREQERGLKECALSSFWCSEERALGLT